MSTASVVLLSNEAATGAGKPIAYGGDYMLRAVGTFGGATVALQQMGPDGATWMDIASASLTAAGSFVVSLAAGVSVRASVASGSPAGLYVSLDQVR